MLFAIVSKRFIERSAYNNNIEVFRTLHEHASNTRVTVELELYVFIYFVIFISDYLVCLFSGYLVNKDAHN